jgi:L-ascorbate metabolism protein UlaG (beta-lactamase superfamily)
MKNIQLILLSILLFAGCSKDDYFENLPEGSLNFGHNSPWKKMAINKMVENMFWIQQSCFRIEGNHVKIYTDPISISTTDVADLILITHPHGDHYSQADIDKLTGPNTVIVTPADCPYTGTAKRITMIPGDEYCIKGIKVQAVPAYNIIKTQFHTVANNWLGYIITMNGVSIYDAGDTERIPEMKDIKCDIALVPLGQTYTMNSVEEAAASVMDVGATVAIPMHFGFYEGTIEDALLFKDLLSGKVNVVVKTREAM